jgi:hypothetical protein
MQISAIDTKENETQFTGSAGVIDAIENEDASNVRYSKINGTKYKVVSNKKSKNSLLDIVKSAIKRDVESGNY